MISIHATLAGGDEFSSFWVDKRKGFLSTPPSRVATRHHFIGWICGSDISIHATLAGGDVLPKNHRPSVHDFYPRHPRGWRLCLQQLIPVILQFLSTPPSRVATTVRSVVSYSGQFLSTPPSRVATGDGQPGTWYHQNFYPRHPRGWRRGLI